MTRILALVLSLSLSIVATAEESDVTILHTGGPTVTALPFYRHFQKETPRVSRTELASLRQPSRAFIRPVRLTDFFPLKTTLMRASELTIKSVPQLSGTIFIIGLDDSSIRWFEASSEHLASIGARGLVVEADSYEQFKLARKFAREVGVTLDIAQGDAIASLYKSYTYPLILVGD